MTDSDQTNIPVPASNDDERVDETLNQREGIPGDISIEPDPNLSGYQDDLATGDSDDVVQHEQGTTPQDVTGIPETVLKEELDKLAIDEMPATSEDEIDEDRREHIEDIDENDKR